MTGFLSVVKAGKLDRTKFARAKHYIRRGLSFQFWWTGSGWIMPLCLFIDANTSGVSRVTREAAQQILMHGSDFYRGSAISKIRERANY